MRADVADLQKVRILLHSCKQVPSLYVEHHYVTSLMVKSIVCLWGGHTSLILTRLLYINASSASADLEACHSSICGKHDSAQSRSCAERGYWTEQRRAKAAATDHDLFLTDYITWGVPGYNFSDFLLWIPQHSVKAQTQKLQHGITEIGDGSSVSVLKRPTRFLWSFCTAVFLFWHKLAFVLASITSHMWKLEKSQHNKILTWRQPCSNLCFTWSFLMFSCSCTKS